MTRAIDGVKGVEILIAKADAAQMLAMAKEHLGSFVMGVVGFMSPIDAPCRSSHNTRH